MSYAPGVKQWCSAQQRCCIHTQLQRPHCFHRQQPHQHALISRPTLTDIFPPRHGCSNTRAALVCLSSATPPNSAPESDQPHQESPSQSQPELALDNFSSLTSPKPTSRKEKDANKTVLEAPKRPLRPKTPSAAAIQAANESPSQLAPDGMSESDQQWARSGSPGGVPPSGAGPAGPAELSPSAEVGGAQQGVAGRHVPAALRQVGSTAQQLSAAAVRKQRMEAARAASKARAVANGGKHDGRKADGKQKDGAKKRIKALRTADGRCIVKVSKETAATQLATAMFRLLLREQRVVLVLGGMYTLFIASRALALANVLMNKVRDESVAFTPIWMEPEDRSLRMKLWPYQVHVSVVPTSDERQQGDVSKVLDYGSDSPARRGERMIQEDRAHHVADILTNAIGAGDDAMVMAASHAEILTTFHAVALCQRRLNQESRPMSPSCTAYFEMLVTGNPNKKGILFYAEPCRKILPTQLPSQMAQMPTSKPPKNTRARQPVSVTAGA